jgi:hypothetical protein
MGGLSTLVACHGCNRGFPYNDLRDGRCLQCMSAERDAAYAVLAAIVGDYKYHFQSCICELCGAVAKARELLAKRGK